MKTVLPLLVCAFALALPAQAKERETDGALDTLVQVTRDLRPRRQRLLHLARSADEQAERGRPCRALVDLTRLGHLVDALAAGRGDDEDDAPRHRAHRRGHERLSQVQAGAVRAALFGAETTLLTGPGTARCGGATPGAHGTAPEVTVIESDAHHLRLHFALPAPHFTSRLGNGRAFTWMIIDGMGLGTDQGKPDLPQLTRQYAIPLGAEVSLQVTSASSYQLHGIDLFPGQASPADASAAAGDPFGDKPFVIDRQVYASRAPYPNVPWRAGPQGMLRDLQTGGVEIDGGQYLPFQRTLRVYTNVDLTLTFAGEKNKPTFGDGRVTSVWNRSYQNIYQRQLINQSAVLANLDPGIIRAIFCGEEMLIITSPLLKPAADALAAARTADGFQVSVVQTGTGDGEAGVTTTAIRSYIHGELTSACIMRPSYVVLMGDTANVPTFLETTTYGVGFDGSIASDLRYVLLNSSDTAPAAAIGRIPAADLATATRVVKKITDYEDHPPLFASTYYNNATIASYFQGAGPQDVRGFVKYSELIRGGLVAAGKTVQRIYVTDSGTVNPATYYDGTAMPAELQRPTFAWAGSGNDIRDAFNAGRFLIFHRDHGGPDEWVHPLFDDATYFSQLTNGRFTPVIVSVNCASGKFDDPGTPHFAEQMLQLSGGGAAGVIGDSRNSPTWANNHVALGAFDAIFPGLTSTHQPILAMGDVLTHARAYLLTQNGLDNQVAVEGQADLFLYNYFGDPSMPIHTQAPVFILRDAVAIRLLEGQIIVTSQQAGLEGAAATFFQGRTALGRALLKGGTAAIGPQGKAGQGAFSVVLDKPGFQPVRVLLNQD